MNEASITGRLTANAVVNGTDRKALKFSIAARYGYSKKDEKELVEFVPCVMFEPSENQEKFLTQEGKGVYVELQGRVSTSRYEVEGQTKYSTQVVVDKRSFHIVTK